MQVSVESTGNLERRMTVEVPEERIAGEVKSRLQKLAKSAKLNGFRPGKVPLNVVKQTFGKQVRDEVLGEVIQSTYYEALSSEKLNPAGYPNIETGEQAAEGLTYTATFEVMPEIELASFDGVSIEKKTVSISDEDVDKMIETLQKQRATFESVDREAKEDDRVTIDFEGKIDGESFQGNSGTNMPVVIGSKRMIEGFETGLVGAKAGDELTLDLQFPEDYAHKEVAGKPVQFEVKVHTVEESVLPEVDDEFVKSLGIEEGTVDGLRAEVTSNMEREVEQRLNATMKESVMDKLLELNQIDVPQALIDSEANTLLQQMQQQMHTPEGKGINLAKSMFEDQAKRRVTLGLIMSEVVKANDLKADTDSVRAYVENMASSYEKPEEVVNYYFGDKKRLAEVESVVLEQAVVDWITEQVTVNESAASFSEVMGQA
jgi:trigger factor